MLRNKNLIFNKNINQVSFFFNSLVVTFALTISK